jgi:hypothetical protein
MKFDEPPHVTVRIKFHSDHSGLQILGVIQAALGDKLVVFDEKWDDGPIFKVGVSPSDPSMQFIIAPTYEAISYIHADGWPLIRELVVVSYEERISRTMQHTGGLYVRLEAATALANSIRRAYDEALASQEWPVWEKP